MTKPYPSTTNSQEEKKREDLTTRRLKVVEQRYGKETLDLASHAAFPLTITSDLLYCLRENFVPNAPWYAVADVLLSGLCSPIGYDLYEMEEETKNGLINRLSKEFGEQQLQKLANFVAQYISNRFSQENNGYRREWIPLSYLMEKGKEAALIREQLEKFLSLEENDMRRVKWKELEEKYSTLEGFEPVVIRQTEQIVTSFEFETVTVDDRGEKIKTEQKQADYFKENLSKTPEEAAELGIEMVIIPGGTFVMGSPETESRRNKNESPQHKVTVQSFSMGKYPVTQAQWQFVAQLPQVNRELDLEPSTFKGDNLSVEGVSWEDAVEFCLRLSKHTGRTYTLPSEAQWEYACRAVNSNEDLTVEEWNEEYNQPFCFGATITGELANYMATITYKDESPREYRLQTTPVGSFSPNAFGLYDMHGNVWEWCKDDYHSNYEGAPTDGSAWQESTRSSRSRYSNIKVLRNDPWYSYPSYCRSAYRFALPHNDSSLGIGFRVVCVVVS